MQVQNSKIVQSNITNNTKYPLEDKNKSVRVKMSI